MARTKTADKEKNPRVYITLDRDSFSKLEALSVFGNKPTATLAAEIVKDYVDKRADEIEEVKEILRAKADYEESVKKLRERVREKNSLFNVEVGK